MPDLKNYVQSELARQRETATVDWSRRRVKWLAELDRLFEFIQSALVSAGFPENNLLLSPHQLNEETLGSYVAPKLSIDLPSGGQVTFTPVGSVIVGGYGRVDVQGRSRKQIMLIADDADELAPGDETPVHERNWVWEFFVPATTSGRRRVQLDEQGLAELMETVSSTR